MWLIAVDEAGYGPQLGPLVVVGTIWHRQEPFHQEPGQDSLNREFTPIRESVKVDGTSIRVDDSKRVFKRKAASSGEHDALGVLHRIASVAWHAMAAPSPAKSRSLSKLIRELAAQDITSLKSSPWLQSLARQQTLPGDLSRQLTDRALCEDAIAAWHTSPWRLVGTEARMINAQSFNDFCSGNQDREARGNKSDLLCETSLTLAASLRNRFAKPADEPVSFFFDRQGGRRYYGPAIEKFLFDDRVEAIHELPAESRYRVSHNPTATGHTIHFTVKGDRFTPVALSSLVAKYLREVAMSALNDYFRVRWDESFGEFKPTAGYPVDAQRFIGSVEPVLARHNIPKGSFIRCR